VDYNAISFKKWKKKGSPRSDHTVKSFPRPTQKNKVGTSCKSDRPITEGASIFAKRTFALLIVYVWTDLCFKDWGMNNEFT